MPCLTAPARAVQRIVAVFVRVARIKAVRDEELRDSGAALEPEAQARPAYYKKAERPKDY